MYERKLGDKTGDSIAKSLKLLLANQTIINIQEVKNNTKENKNKDLTKSYQNNRVSSIKSHNSRLYSSKSSLNDSPHSVKKSIMVKKSEILSKSVYAPNRNTINKIN